MLGLKLLRVSKRGLCNEMAHAELEPKDPFISVTVENCADETWL